MDKFLETYNLPRQNQDKIDNINRLITRCEIESVIKKKNLATNKSPGPYGFMGEFYQTYTEELVLTAADSLNLPNLPRPQFLNCKMTRVAQELFTSFSKFLMHLSNIDALLRELKTPSYILNTHFTGNISSRLN